MPGLQGHPSATETALRKRADWRAKRRLAEAHVAEYLRYLDEETAALRAVSFDGWQKR